MSAPTQTPSSRIRRHTRRGLILGDLDKTEAGIVLSISPRTVDKLIAKKAIPGMYRIGNRVRFRRAEFEAWHASLPAGA